MNYKNFYSELGKLLYAVASCDGVITEQEREEMLAIVEKELIPEEKQRDEFGSNAAHYATIEFDYLDSEMIDSDTAFQSFIDYVEEHHTAIDEKMKDTCLYITEQLAAAYRGTNKKEKQMIDKLKNCLNKIA